MPIDKTLLRSQKTVDSLEPEMIRTKLLELGWQQKRLYSADYMFWTINFKRVGIERKAVNDLFGSLGERLANQMYKQLEFFDFNILLIEGSWKNVYGSSMSIRGMEFYQWSTIWNFLRSWQDKGMTIELTTNEGHTVRRLNELYAYYQKDVHSGGLKKKTISGDPRLLALQCGGIGPKLGTALIEKFGSLKAIANANAKDFQSVEKVGKKKALALYSHFNKGINDNPLLVDPETGEIEEDEE
jgi:ERCC4-type nuclease